MGKKRADSEVDPFGTIVQDADTGDELTRSSRRTDAYAIRFATADAYSKDNYSGTFRV